jgi:hypothetical protein
MELHDKHVNLQGFQQSRILVVKTGKIGTDPVWRARKSELRDVNFLGSAVFAIRSQIYRQNSRLTGARVKKDRNGGTVLSKPGDIGL